MAEYDPRDETTDKDPLILKKGDDDDDDDPLKGRRLGGTLTLQTQSQAVLPPHTLKVK